ncbi:MAG: transglycosylase domain-containing protein [Bacteroidota bacterium]
MAHSSFPDQLKSWLSQSWQGISVWGKAHPWWTGFFAFGLFGLSFILLFQQMVVWGAFGKLPTEDELRHLKLPIASQVYSVDGKLLGRYFLEERDPLNWEELPQPFVETLLATEDVRFYSHQGSDWQAMLRVLFKTVLMGNESAGGGSTLTQQLAKNLYPRKGRGLFPLVVNKLREMETANRLERLYSKDEILLLYLNTVSFGENAFGLKVASQRFFGKAPNDLKREEMAVLVGMLKAPTSYNPRLHPLAARHRRNVVLQQMVRYEYLWPQMADSLMELPLEIQYHRNTHHQGVASYFREMLRQEMLLWCKQHPKWDGGHYNLYTDGLIIHTTIHSDLQKMAESAVAEQMKRIQRNFSQDWRYARHSPVPESLVQQAMRVSPRYRSWQQEGYTEIEIDSLFDLPVPMRLFSWQEDSLRGVSPKDSIRYEAELLHCGLLAMDPQNGHVRAWVGGIQHDQFQFDHVRAARQSGSTFKPLVFATALEEGYSPCEYIANEQVSFARYDNWTPKNADRSYGGEYSLQGALTHSFGECRDGQPDDEGQARAGGRNEPTPGHQTGIACGAFPRLGHGGSVLVGLGAGLWHLRQWGQAVAAEFFAAGGGSGRAFALRNQPTGDPQTGNQQRSRRHDDPHAPECGGQRHCPGLALPLRIEDGHRRKDWDHPSPGRWLVCGRDRWIGRGGVGWCE